MVRRQSTEATMPSDRPSDPWSAHFNRFAQRGLRAVYEATPDPMPNEAQEIPTTSAELVLANDVESEPLPLWDMVGYWGVYSGGQLVSPVFGPVNGRMQAIDWICEAKIWRRAVLEQRNDAAKTG
jgi:hypothetical protein